MIKQNFSDTSNSFKLMCKFAETYAKKTDTYFCLDLSVTAVVIEGLAKNKDDYGSPLCPCRHYDDKNQEVLNTYWNCPCVPMRERKECHCMLFLSKDNEFASDNQQIESNVLLNLVK
uniref:Ferredoxin-thioredoxin reductase, catalytic chain n=1 Tax=Taenioma perpusillum TaxID=210852 RepID=A0A1Z1MRQ9_9FLOR|nr:ferredoxin thioreductase subunit b [Taenioma perpusillum]ARW68445.1 ferredoxin thioreductase subunit b [Taenioma perpusillum]